MSRHLHQLEPGWKIQAARLLFLRDNRMRRSSSCSTDSDTGSTFSVFPAVYVRFGMPCVVIEYEALRKLGWSWCDITVNKFDGVSQPGTEYLCPQEYEVFLPRGDVMLADRNEASHRLHIAACIIKLALQRESACAQLRMVCWRAKDSLEIRVTANGIVVGTLARISPLNCFAQRVGLGAAL